MTLRHMSRGLLSMFAGGDPWKVNETLQSGRPTQIGDMAQAFHNAGRSTRDADQVFNDARKRLDAWVQDDGRHPITNSPGVQRTIAGLHLQSDQLPRIAADLETIAAALAQSQGTAAGYTSTLDARLQTLDDWIGQAEDMIAHDQQLLAEADDEDDVDELEDDIERLQNYITDCEREAIDDTKATLQGLVQLRDQYADGLTKAKANLWHDGLDPNALYGEDGEAPKPGDIAPSGLEPGELAGLNHVMNQAVVDQMAKVRAAKQALDDAARDAYMGGAGSAAFDRLPELKKNYADALNDLGKLPNYGDIDPSSMRSSADGHFLFGYDADGQPVQVTGQLKNGSGEIFDEGRGTYYTFKDGKLVGMRTPDPGKVEATSEPLFTAVTLAVGGPEIKAGGEAAVQGFKSLLERRAIGLGGDITSENVLGRTFQAAEARTEAAQAQLAAEHAEHVPASLPPGALADHPPPVTSAEHPGPAPVGPESVGHEPPVLAGSHVPVEPLPEVPQALPHDSPLFEGYHPTEPGPEFTNADGSLHYPDETLPGHVYAIPGTVEEAHLPTGTIIDRFGSPYGGWLGEDGVPFAERSLPPDSVGKPFYRYVVEDPAALPPGWRIEQSQAAPWFNQPGGGMQYRILNPDGDTGSVEELTDFGFLRRIG